MTAGVVGSRGEVTEVRGGVDLHLAWRKQGGKRKCRRKQGSGAGNSVGVVAHSKWTTAQSRQQEVMHCALGWQSAPWRRRLRYGEQGQERRG